MNFKRTKEDHYENNFFLFSCEGEVENLILAGTLVKNLRRGDT